MIKQMQQKEVKSPLKTFIGGLVIGLVVGGVIGWLSCASWVVSQLQ